MAAIDERRIDPTTDELTDLLDRAARRASARLKARRVERTRVGWRRFLRPHKDEPEGHEVISGGATLPAARVEVSWWTDRLGRKHWRVIGQRRGLDFGCVEYNLFDTYPLWHVYPEGLALRRRDKATELVAVCRCGAVGTLASLAWAGNRCGPCHDRREEGAPPPSGPAFPLSLSRHTDLVPHLAFTADDRLVTGGDDGRIVLWDLATGAGQVLLHRSGGRVNALAVSAKGLVAAATSMPNRLLLADLNGDPWKWQTLTVQTSSIVGLAFSPDGAWLSVVGYPGMFLMQPPSAHLVPVNRPSRPWPTHTFHLGDRWTALALDYPADGLFRIDLASGEQTPLPPLAADVPHVLVHLDEDGEGGDGEGPAAVSPDGQWLAVADCRINVYGVQLLRLAGGPWQHLSPRAILGPVVAMQFTPQGDLVLADGAGTVESWAPATQQFLGAVTFQARQWEGTRAFTPDGTRLVIPGRTGDLVVWPWRQLLTA